MDNAPALCCWWLMRILWIRRGSTGSDAGDSIYDDKLQHALADHFSVTNCPLTCFERKRQLISAGLSLSLPEQFNSGTPEDETRVRALLQTHDIAIFSHEHLDRFARAMRPHTKIPFIALRQNVTSDAMASILDTNPPLAGLYRVLAAQQERTALHGALYQAITAISARDLALLTTLSGRGDVTLVMPGAPPAIPLAPDADLRRDLVVSGTYDWFPKARDIARFADEYAAAPAPDARLWLGAAAPGEVRAKLNAGEEQSLDYGAAIRFGITTDRFTAGHKLKTAAYLVNNCAVISFARVIDDFADLPFAANWIVQVSHANEIDGVMRKIAAQPIEILRAQLTELKAAITERFSWGRQASALANAIERVSRA